MSVYFIANISIRDPLEYKKYLDRSEEIFARYKGTYLAVDDSPFVLEGEWHNRRMVLISFDNQEDFEAWYHSEEYQEILQYRLAASVCDSILVQGH